jgi:hypothetical protein
MRGNLPPYRQARAFATMKRNEQQVQRFIAQREKWLAVRRITKASAWWGELYDHRRKASLAEGMGTMSNKKLRRSNKKERKKVRKAIRRAKENAKEAGLPYIGAEEHIKPDFEIVRTSECGPPTAAVRALLHTGAAIERALVKQADDLMVERHAAAAAAFAGRRDREEKLEVWLSKHAGARAALQKLAKASGPLRIEHWAAGLDEEETEAVAELAEWALACVWKEKVKGVVKGAVGIRGSAGRVRAGLRVDRARLAVSPKLMYPQLSSIVDMAEVLGAQVPPPLVTAEEVAKGVYWKKKDRDAKWQEGNLLEEKERPEHPAHMSQKLADSKAEAIERNRKDALFKVRFTLQNAVIVPVI